MMHKSEESMLVESLDVRQVVANWRSTEVAEESWRVFRADPTCTVPAPLLLKRIAPKVCGRVCETLEITNNLICNSL